MEGKMRLSGEGVDGIPYMSSDQRFLSIGRLQ